MLLLFGMISRDVFTSHMLLPTFYNASEFVVHVVPQLDDGALLSPTDGKIMSVSSETCCYQWCDNIPSCRAYYYDNSTDTATCTLLNHIYALMTLPKATGSDPTSVIMVKSHEMIMTNVARGKLL